MHRVIRSNSAGSRDLGDIREEYFEVRPARQSVPCEGATDWAVQPYNPRMPAIVLDVRIGALQ